MSKVIYLTSEIHSVLQLCGNYVAISFIQAA